MARNQEPGIPKPRKTKAHQSVALPFGPNTVGAGDAVVSPVGTNDARLASWIIAIAGPDPDGWLRIIPDEKGRFYYVKWKFTRGRYANHYVMASGDIAALDEALVQCHRKVYEVRAGTRKPTPDQWHETHYNQG